MEKAFPPGLRKATAAMFVAPLLSAIVGLVLVAESHPSYQSKIPNGGRVMRSGVLWPGVGHDNRAGGGVRNTFGADFVTLGGRGWTVALCEADSDGDGFTNGQELGDPSCTWKEGDGTTTATVISHPGFADSTPVSEGASNSNAGSGEEGSDSSSLSSSLSPSPRSVPLSPGESGVVDGYLVDMESAALPAYQEYPERYTVGDAMRHLMTTRFTIMISEAQLFVSSSTPSSLPSAPNRFVPFYNLSTDELTESLVKGFLMRRPAVHYEHGYLRVYASGSLLSSAGSTTGGSFSMNQLWPAPVKVSGYLADIFCVDRIIALDGPNMIVEPEKHSVHCALFTVCIPGGYTLLLKPTDPASVGKRYGAMYNLTTQGNQIAVRWLRTLPEHQTDIRVQLHGTVTPDGLFVLSEETASDGTSGSSITPLFNPVLPVWAIAVIVIACTVFVLGIGVGVICFVCHRGRRQQSKGGSDVDGKTNPSNIASDDGIVAYSPSAASEQEKIRHQPR